MYFLQVINSFIGRQLADVNEASLIRLLKIFSVASAVVLFYAFIFSGFQVVDEFEHLHSSWLVSIGKVPYRDFFEHHHPLLWYLSAPLLSLFYDNAAVFYVMRAVSAAISVISLLFIYKIALLFTNHTGAWFAIALTLGNIITLYNFSQFRPDNFMNCCFLCGLYFLLCYLQDRKRLSLVYSFAGFTFSVLFLQKISLLLIVVEVLMLVFFCNKKMSLKDISLAAIPSITVLFIFLLFLLKKQALASYLELNINFNQAMITYFDRGSFWYRNLFLSFYGIALLAALWFFRKGNIYYRITAVLFFAEFLMRGYYFAPHPNYYTLLTMLAALVSAPLISSVFPKHKFITVILVVALFLRLGLLFNKIDETSAKHNSYTHYKLADYVHKNSSADDYLMNGYDKNFNIYRPDVSYYWFGLDMLLPIMELEYDIKNKPDVNAFILQYRPKFIYTANYPDLRAYRTYGEYKFTQFFIPELIKELYAPTPFANLAVLK